MKSFLNIYNFFIDMILRKFYNYILFFLLFVFLFNNFIMILNRDISYFPLYPDTTIINYLSSLGNNLFFSNKGYPAFGVENYQPGPLVYIYLLELAEIIYKFTGISIFFIFNTLIHIFSILLLLLSLWNFKKVGDRKLLLVACMFFAFSTIFSSNSRLILDSIRIDAGTNHLSFIAIYFTSAFYLSVKMRESSHIPLLLSSAFMMQAHYLALGFGVLGFLFSSYYIANNKGYKAKVRFLQAVSYLFYFPLILRFLSDPFFVFDALNSSGIQNNRLYITDISKLKEIIYTLTPTGYFFDSCTMVNNNCFSNSMVIFSIIIFISILFFSLIYFYIKGSLFIRVILGLSILIFIFTVLKAHEFNHLSVLAGILFSIFIIFVSRFIIIFLFLPIIIIMLIIEPVERIDSYNYNLFSSKYLEVSKNYKYKIDLCSITIVNDCSNIGKDNNGKIFKLFTYEGNAVSMLLAQFKLNNNDICLTAEGVDLGELNYLKCTKEEESNIERRRLIFIPFEKNSPNRFGDFVKIGYIFNKKSLLCKDINYLDTHCSNSNAYSKKDLYEVSIYIENKNLYDEEIYKLLKYDEEYKLSNPIHSLDYQGKVRL
jgi:hypothetical protein